MARHADNANADPIEAVEAALGGSNVPPAHDNDAGSDGGDDAGATAAAAPAKGRAGQQGRPEKPRQDAAAGAGDRVAPDADAGDELLRQLGAAARDALADDEVFDNLELLDRREQQAQARRQAEEQARAQAAGGEGGEGGDEGEDGAAQPQGQDEGADEGAEDDEGDEGGDDDQDTGSWGEFLDRLGLDGDGAQALLDHLLNDSKYASQLRLRYRANGQDVEEPWSEVRQKAAGYHGMPEVTRRLQEADTRLREAEAKEATVSAAMQHIEALLKHIDDPVEFVEKTIAPNSGLDYMIALRDELNRHISEAESDPGSFRLQQELNQIKRVLAQLVGGEAAPARATAGAEAAEPPTNGKRAASSSVPEDFGFVPGVGYGDHAEAVFAALREAVRLSDGIEVQAVLDQWKQEGRRRPVFDVLRDMVKLRSSEKPKREIARKPPAAIPSGTRAGRQPTRPNPNARRPPRWEDIPDALARDLQRLMGAGS
ncbi:MAG TPA: hypothetical protein VKZ85_03330 [Woeseiaceae bacterium]|nr:hypothetical protein [Woeseiaceae bacterium]